VGSDLIGSSCVKHCAIGSGGKGGYINNWIITL
jgi:hypothetical protein